MHAIFNYSPLVRSMIKSRTPSTPGNKIMIRLTMFWLWVSLSIEQPSDSYLRINLHIIIRIKIRRLIPWSA